MTININYESSGIFSNGILITLPEFNNRTQHPKYVKNVKVLSKDDKIIEFDQEISTSGKMVHSTNKLTLCRDQGKIGLEVVGGDSIGSKAKMIFIETRRSSSVTTHIKLEGEFRHGRLEHVFGRFVKGTRAQKMTTV